MADETQGEGSGAVATQEPMVSEEVLNQWETLGEDTTPETPPAAGSENAPATTAEGSEVQEAKAGETPAVPATAAPGAASVWTPSAQQLHTLQRANLKIEDLQTLPDKGQGITEKLAKSWNDLGARWAQLGVAQGAQGGASPPTNAATVPGAQPGAAPAAASPPAAAAAANAGIDFGIDPAVWGEDGAKHLNTVLQNAVAPFMQKISYLEGQARTRENDALRQQVTTKFDAWAKDYDAYGDVKGDHSKLTPAQKDARQKVLTLADHILVGATVDGVQLNPADALAQAHEALTAEFRVQKTRNNIAAQVTTRKKQFGTRPVSRTPGSQTNPEAAAAEKWEEGIKALESAA